MSGEITRWFVAFIEDGQPVEILTWSDWVARDFDERPENSHLVFGKDHMDAFVRAQRGEYLNY